MKIKVCHVFSDVDQSHLVKTFGDAMDKGKYDISFVFLGLKKPLLFDYFGSRGHKVEFVEFSGKRDLPKAIWKLRQIFKLWRPDIIHTHLVEGSVAGLTAAKLSRGNIAIHTRHHGAEAHIYSPHGVYYDRYNNYLSKKIIAISNVVSDVLIARDGVDRSKVVTIPHGFHLENIVDEPGVTETLKKKHDLNGHYPVVGSVARYIHWKGVHNTVKAFASLLEEYPNGKLVLANASGPYIGEIKTLLTTLPKENYVEIEFEPQMISLYPAFDIFVHIPVQREVEAFGMVYIEPLALGVPSVFTLSGAACEFVKDKVNALVVPYDDPSATRTAIVSILEDGALRNHIVENGRADVWNLFNAERFSAELDALYTDLSSSKGV
jgi:glycosyltransferase involved in cell wall biosynthesis